MPFAGSLTLIRIFGIRVQMHWTLLILALLITWSLAAGWFPSVLAEARPVLLILLGLAGAIGLFISIAIHELSHALVARRFHMPIERITLFLFGGVAHMDDEPPSPKAEFWMAIAGPIASLLLAFIALIATRIGVAWGAPEWALALGAYFASINLTVAIFNMLPGYPLDGGRVLRAILWAARKDIVSATRVSSTIGQFFGFALITLGVIGIFATGNFGGFWTILIGGLIIRFARQSYVALLVKQALQGASVQTFMDPDPVVVGPDATVGALMRIPPKIDDQLIYPIAREDKSLIGLVDLRKTKSVPPDQWDQHAIQEFAEPLPNDIQIQPDARADTALSKMNEAGTTELMVVKDNHLLGVLSIHSLVRQVQLHLRPRSTPTPNRPLPI
ncbi:MAG: site-2 protease family protein [Bdellovibrionaceae bacterium]|nr:site-2 protease family protein [Pseudobdellovibrionaceae bacterium]